MKSVVLNLAWIGILVASSAQASGYQADLWKTTQRIAGESYDVRVVQVTRAKTLATRQEIDCVRDNDEVEHCQYQDTYADTIEVTVSYTQRNDAMDLTNTKKSELKFQIDPLKLDAATLAQLLGPQGRERLKLKLDPVTEPVQSIDFDRSEICDRDYALEHPCEDKIVYQTVYVTSLLVTLQW